MASRILGNQQELYDEERFQNKTTSDRLLLSSRVKACCCALRRSRLMRMFLCQRHTVPEHKGAAVFVCTRTIFSEVHAHQRSFRPLHLQPSKQQLAKQNRSAQSTVRRKQNMASSSLNSAISQHHQVHDSDHIFNQPRNWKSFSCCFAWSKSFEVVFFSPARTTPSCQRHVALYYAHLQATLHPAVAPPQEHQRLNQPS